MLYFGDAALEVIPDVLSILATKLRCVVQILLGDIAKNGMVPAGRTSVSHW